MRKPQDAGDATHVPRPWPALDKRCKAVVSTAMRSLLMAELEAVPNMTYFLREIRLLEPEQRLGALEELLRTFAEDFKKLLSKPHIAADLDIALLRLDIESATELWLSLNIRYRQWDALAKALNALLPAGKKFSGGLVPCTDSMKAWLSKQGGRLSESDVTHVTSFRNEASTILVDLTQLDEEDGAPIGADVLDAAMQVEWPRFAYVQDSQQAAEHGYLVKNAMQRVIAPEVEALIKVSPETLLRWRIHGMDIVLAADGTAIVRFTSRSFKLETGACKIIALHAEGQQQAASMGIPLFVHDGEECYAGLQATLGRMIQDGHLTKAVCIIVEGEQANLCALAPVCRPAAGQLGIRVWKCFFSTPMLPVLLGTQ
jgi:hypothetical protein